ncbi:MAG: hypothetical protein ACK40H_05995, partial [Sphingomonadaceae bacterium]
FDRATLVSNGTYDQLTDVGAGFDFRVLEPPPSGRPEEGLDLPPPPAATGTAPAQPRPNAPQPRRQGS